MSTRMYALLLQLRYFHQPLPLLHCAQANGIVAVAHWWFPGDAPILIA